MFVSEPAVYFSKDPPSIEEKVEIELSVKEQSLKSEPAD